MFKNNYALALIVDGNIVTETKDRKITLPFGTEYTVRLINKNNWRSAADLYLNGEQVGRFILDAGETSDIERFIDGNNYSGKRFQFVSLGNGKVVDKNNFENGVVEVQWFKEIIPPTPIIVKEYIERFIPYPEPYPVYPKPWRNPWNEPYYGDKFYCVNGTAGNFQASTTGNDHKINVNNVSSVDCSSKSASTPGKFKESDILRFSSKVEGKEGSTVRGSESNQQFKTITGLVFDSVATILKLKIVSGKIEVATQYCSKCGQKRRSGDQYCPKDGTKY